MYISKASTQVLWKRFYEEAVVEADPQRFLQHLDAAQKAIHERLLELRSGGEQNLQELLELDDARRTIVSLRRMATK